MSIYDDIKSKIDIVDYIRQYVPLEKSGRYFKACCPFHAEKTPSFIVNTERQEWHCFGACAERGDIVDFAQKYHNWTHHEALQELAKQAGVEYKGHAPNPKQDHYRGIVKEAAASYHRILAGWKGAEPAWKYLRNRGFTAEIIEKFNIGFAPDDWHAMTNHLIELGAIAEDLLAVSIMSENADGKQFDMFRNRIIFPIHDHRGRGVGFAGRTLTDDTPKYLNSRENPIFHKSDLLYGVHLAKSIDDTMVVVEGYTDVMTAHQYGFTNVVGQMGTSLTEQQVKRLQNYASVIVIALDGDDAGQNSALRTAKNLVALNADIRIMGLPADHDPDSLLRENDMIWQQMVEHAIPVAEYVINTTCTGITPESPIAERERIARELVPVLNSNTNDIYRDDYLKQLSNRLDIPIPNLRVLNNTRRGAVSDPPGTSPSTFTGRDLGRGKSNASLAEQSLLATIINDEMIYAWIVRAFRSLKLSLPDGQDFANPTLSRLFDAYKVAARPENYELEPSCWIEDNADSTLTRALEYLQKMDMRFTQQAAIQTMLRLRYNRLSSDAQTLIDNGLNAQARNIIKIKQKVLYYLNHSPQEATR